jgi:ribonuclease-3
MLQEASQAKNLGTPIYVTLDSSGPDHAKSFTVAVQIGSNQIATGIGASKQKAEIEAAKAAYTRLFSQG